MRVEFEDPERLIQIPPMEVEAPPTAGEVAAHAYPYMKRTRGPSWHVETNLWQTAGVIKLKDRDISFKFVRD